MNKTICAFLLIIMLSITACTSTEKKNTTISENMPDSEVLLKVNGEPVNKAEFYQTFNKLFYSSPYGKAQISLDDPKNTKLMLMFRQRAVNDILVKHFIDTEAKKNNIKVSDEDVSALYDQIAERMGGKDKLIMQLQLTKMDEKAFRDTLKSDLFAKKTLDTLTKNISVNDDDAKKYYEEHKLDKFDVPESVKASHIFFKANKALLQQEYMQKNPVNPNASDAEKEKISKDAENYANLKFKEKKQKANEALKDVLAHPEAFDELVNKYSEDRLSALHGGDIGYFPKGKLDDKIDAVVFDKNKVQVGKVYNQLVETNIGFHIIKVTDHRNKGIIPFDSVKNDLKRILVDNKKIDFLTKFVNDKKKTAKIDYIYSQLNPVEIQKQLSAQINTPADQALKDLSSETKTAAPESKGK